MFLLRRAATRAISTPTLFTQPRFLSTTSPALRLARQQQPQISRLLQTRFASDDASKKDETENFAQTAAEAPVDADLTPVQQEAQAEPTDASATITPDTLAAVEKAADKASPRRVPNDKSKAPAEPSNVVYVGNLYYEVTQEQIERVFSRFGPLEKTKIIYDARGVSRGFGYAYFKNVSDAQAAIDNLDMQVFEGRNLVLRFARSSGERGPRRAVTEGAIHNPSPPTKSLFLGNLSFEMSDKDLNDLFREIRNVTDVRVAIDRRTGQPRGFAHADFIDVESATRAKEALTGKVLYGREIRLDFSNSTRHHEQRKQSQGAQKVQESQETAP